MEQKKDNDLMELVPVIKKGKRFLLCGHVMPDGDCLGSVCGLGLALKSSGKEVFMVSEDKIPDTYDFMPGIKDFITLEDIPDDIDTAIILDCSDLNRCGDELSNIIAKITLVINIDHHISNRYFGKFNHVRPDAAAAGEIVWELIKKMGVNINQDIAACIYTAIVMDTGSFRFSNTTANTHRIVAELMNYKINTGKINTHLFEEKSIVALKLLGEALTKMEVSPCGRIAWIKIPHSTMERLGAREEHTDGLVNYPKTVKNAEIGLLFREVAGGKIKVGLRSKGLVDVNRLAAEFGGGGHPQAAGCVIEGKLDEVEKKILAKAYEYLS